MWFGWLLPSSVRSGGSELHLGFSPQLSATPLQMQQLPRGQVPLLPSCFENIKKDVFFSSSFFPLFEPHPCFLAATSAASSCDGL